MRVVVVEPAFRASYRPCPVRGEREEVCCCCGGTGNMDAAAAGPPLPPASSPLDHGAELPFHIPIIAAALEADGCCWGSCVDTRLWRWWWRLPGIGFVTVVTLISLRVDFVVRPAAEVSERDEEEEERDEDSDAMTLGASGDALSNCSTGVSSLEGRGSAACHGTGACVLSRDTNGSALPQVVFDVRGREWWSSISLSGPAVSTEEREEREARLGRPRVERDGVLLGTTAGDRLARCGENTISSSLVRKASGEEATAPPDALTTPATAAPSPPLTPTFALTPSVPARGSLAGRAAATTTRGVTVISTFSGLPHVPVA